MARRQISRTRGRAGLERRAGSRPARPTTLIVCEGATEEEYFRLVCRKLGLPAEFVLHNTVGSAPINVVKCAENRLRDYGSYDTIFCVFDRDTHESFERACKQIQYLANRTQRRLNIRGVASRPCFEVWVLLHFERTDRPFGSCDAVAAYIREQGYLPGYRKGDPGRLRSLIPLLDTAVDNACWLAAQVETTKGNPGTSLHELVQHLSASASSAR